MTKTTTSNHFFGGGCVLGIKLFSGSWCVPLTGSPTVILLVPEGTKGCDGACLAGAGAFILASVLPNFHWDSIISGFKDEQEEWTRIFQGYEGLLRMAQILERDEMLAQEYQKVEELRNAAALNDRNLPEDP